MRPFAYRRALDAEAAIAEAVLETPRPGAAFIAGGTELMQLWKAGISAPAEVIDISRLPFDQVDLFPDRVVIGALARMSDVAGHPSIRAECPAIAEALLASASAQLRNMATIGGNLLQRTRCAYFRNAALPCNKRRPGSGCPAVAGENRRHAIFGASEHCVATHASDLAVALVALDATICLRGAGGERALPLADFYLVPGSDPTRETVLAPGDLVVAVEVPRAAAARRSCYVKLRDRASFDFALVSVAVALEVRAGRVSSVRIAAGGVGTKPWQLGAGEAALIGAASGGEAFRKAAERAADGAACLAGNGFKVELLRRTVERALAEAGAMHVHA